MRGGNGKRAGGLRMGARKHFARISLPIPKVFSVNNFIIKKFCWLCRVQSTDKQQKGCWLLHPTKNSQKETQTESKLEICALETTCKQKRKPI